MELLSFSHMRFSGSEFAVCMFQGTAPPAFFSSVAVFQMCVSMTNCAFFQLAVSFVSNNFCMTVQSFRHSNTPFCMPAFVFRLFQIHRPRHSSETRAELIRDCSWRVLEISASETLRFICLLMSSSALFTWYRHNRECIL